jgi:molecular chaperone GrpE
VVKIPIKTEKDEEEGSDAAEQSQEPSLSETMLDEEGEQERSEPVAGEATGENESLGTFAEAHKIEEVEEAEEEDEVSRLTKQLQAKEQEAREHYEARLRLQAEFDNFKKRKEREIADFRKYANESFLLDILPVVDDFERAIAAAEQTHKLEDFLEGVELLLNKFLDVLGKKGIKEIEAEAGQPFNPELHEAVMPIETDEVEEGTIAQVFQKGYYLHDRVLLAPKVGVAKKKE